MTGASKEGASSGQAAPSDGEWLAGVQKKDYDAVRWMVQFALPPLV